MCFIYTDDKTPHFEAVGGWVETGGRVSEQVFGLQIAKGRLPVILQSVTLVSHFASDMWMGTSSSTLFLSLSLHLPLGLFLLFTSPIPLSLSIYLPFSAAPPILFWDCVSKQYDRGLFWLARRTRDENQIVKKSTAVSRDMFCIIKLTTVNS